METIRRAQSDTDKIESENDLETAISLIDAQIGRLTESADRFRPFDARVTDLLEEAAVLLRSGRRNLVLHGLKIQPKLLESLARIPSFFDDPDRFDGESHYFVIDAGMARRILLKTLHDALDTVTFFQKTEEITLNAKSRKIYRAVRELENDLCQEMWRVITSYRRFSPPAAGLPGMWGAAQLA